MRAMRLRAAAWGILLVAVVDLVALVAFYMLGWVQTAEAGAGLAARLALPLAFIVLVLTMLGAASILVTSRGQGAGAWIVQCFECGRQPDNRLDFCHHCGATV